MPQAPNNEIPYNVPWGAKRERKARSAPRAPRAQPSSWEAPLQRAIEILENPSRPAGSQLSRLIVEAPLQRAIEILENPSRPVGSQLSRLIVMAGVVAIVLSLIILAVIFYQHSQVKNLSSLERRDRAIFELKEEIARTNKRPEESKAVALGWNQPRRSYASNDHKQRDRDGDGRPDRYDKCPDEPGPLWRSGCPPPPDRDGDLVLDRNDACPTQRGWPGNQGCPVGQFQAKQISCRWEWRLVWVNGQLHHSWQRRCT